MHSFVRALPLALAILVTTSSHGDDALPPIFAPRLPASPTPVAPRGAAPSLLSNRLRSFITQEVLAHADAFSVPDASAAAKLFEHRERDIVELEKYFVRAAPFQRIELPAAESPLLTLLKTGRLYRHVGRKVDAELTLHCVPLLVGGYGMGVATTRVELRFSLRW